MLNKRDFILAGTVGKPHGISGETSVRLNANASSNEIEPTFIFIEIDNELVPFRITSSRYKKDEILLVKLPLLATEDKIRALMDCNVFINPTEITKPSADLNQLDSFTGYLITDVNTGNIGEITGIQDISGNPLFMVDGASGEILIPVAEDLVVEIDDQKRQILMDIPDVLLDIN